MTELQKFHTRNCSSLIAEMWTRRERYENAFLNKCHVPIQTTWILMRFKKKTLQCLWLSRRSAQAATVKVINTTGEQRNVPTFRRFSLPWKEHIAPALAQSIGTFGCFRASRNMLREKKREFFANKRQNKYLTGSRALSSATCLKNAIYPVHRRIRFCTMAELKSHGLEISFVSARHVDSVFVSAYFRVAFFT